jgi:hypothetical protein
VLIDTNKLSTAATKVMLKKQFYFNKLSDIEKEIQMNGSQN